MNGEDRLTFPESARLHDVHTRSLRLLDRQVFTFPPVRDGSP